MTLQETSFTCSKHVEVLCNETPVPTVEMDSGDSIEIGSVMEGEENKNHGLVSVPGSPGLQGQRGEQQRDEMLLLVSAGGVQHWLNGKTDI